MSTVIPWFQPIRSVITVAGIRASIASCSRIFTSTASTIDPPGVRTYFGGPSDARADVAQYVDFFNRRLHGQSGLIPPAEFETSHRASHPATL